MAKRLRPSCVSDSHPSTLTPQPQPQDVTKRLEPFIVDYLERQTSPVVVISHISTLQVVLLLCCVR
jgi:broad specificity phosphatase PhoE